MPMPGVPLPRRRGIDVWAAAAQDDEDNSTVDRAVVATTTDPRP
jgi:hypothetical protein